MRDEAFGRVARDQAQQQKTASRVGKGWEETEESDDAPSQSRS